MHDSHPDIPGGLRKSPLDGSNLIRRIESLDHRRRRRPMGRVVICNSFRRHKRRGTNSTAREISTRPTSISIGRCHGDWQPGCVNVSRRHLRKHSRVGIYTELSNSVGIVQSVNSHRPLPHVLTDGQDNKPVDVVAKYVGH